MDEAREANRQVMDRLEDMFRDVKLSHMEAHMREHHHQPVRRTPERQLQHAGSCPQSRKNSVDPHHHHHQLHQRSPGPEVRRASHDIRRTSTASSGGVRRPSSALSSAGSSSQHQLHHGPRKGSGTMSHSLAGRRLEPGHGHSSGHSRRFSTDSLESGGRRDSLASVGSGGSGGSGHLADLIEENEDAAETTTIHSGIIGNARSERSSPGERPRFIPVTSLEDVQAVRCAEFHPYGKVYAVGSNSKTLRICAYPKLIDLRDDHVTQQPTVLLKRPKHHKGSIYCLAWSPVGDLLATGSNDKTIKLMRFNADSCTVDEPPAELTMHDGTVRDVCFIEDMSNKSSLLVSGGAGDCKVYVTDCVTGIPFQAMAGHTGHVLSLYTWGGAVFVSGSHDRTVRVWDLRSGGCVNRLTPASALGAHHHGSPVSSVAVEPSGRMLVSGHEDGTCGLYDLRGDRSIQTLQPHDGEVRSVRFSPHAFYLLTCGYDQRLALSDLQGDLTMPLPSVTVARHQDKVISGRWHPYEFSFISTGADKTCNLWALPPV